MSDEIKKLLSIMNETTTSGSVAPVAGGIGKSMLKRPADSIFAAESVPSDADTGLEAAPKVDSPANFGLWKNSAVIGKEQYGKHGRKKMKVDKTQMYPQASLKEGASKQDQQAVLDTTRDSRLGSERNTGLNEPDEMPSSHKEVDFGTWHFTINGVPQKKDGKVYYSSSKEHNDEVLAHLRKKAEKSGNSDVAIEVVQGPIKMQESYSEPKDMDDWSEEDWAEWDAKVGRVGAKAKAQEKDQGVAEGSGTGTAASIVNFIKSEINRYYEQDNDFAAEWLSELVHNITDSRPGWKKLTYDEVMQGFIQYDIDRLLKIGDREAKQIVKVYDNLKQQLISKFGPKQGVAGRKAKLDEYSEWDGTGDQDLAAATAANGQEAGFADIEDKTSISEDGELKRVKREYNQAAKDAGGDRPGAGKKIDNMKKSLRQRDVGKDRSIANESGPRLVDKDGNEIKKKQSGPAPRTPERQLRSGDARSTQHGVATMTSKGLTHRPNTDTTPKPRFVEEGSEITEEMIADRLKSELDIFKKGTKSPDKSIGKKPADREVQEKRTESKSSMTKKSKK